MKRIIAIALAALMLLGMAALAEQAAPTAAIMTIGNFNLSVDAGGQSQSMGMGDLDVTLALDTAQTPTLLCEFANATDALADFYLQIVDDQILFYVEGQDHAYGETIPAEANLPVAQLPAVFQMLVPMMDQIALPPITGLSVPKMDLTGILAPYMDGDTFEIPYETVMGAVDSILDAAKQYAGDNAEVAQGIQMISSLRSMGMGIAITGEIEDDGTTQTAAADVLLVTQGKTSNTPVAQLIASSAADAMVVSLGVDMGSGSMTTLATLEIMADPAMSELNVELDVMGAYGMAFSIFNEDGLQKLAFDVKSSEANANLEFGYGQQGGMDVVSLSGSADKAGSFSVVIETAMGADGIRTGTLTVDVNTNGQKITATGDITMYLGELNLSVNMPSDIRAFSDFDKSEVETAMQAVTDYLMTVTQAA